MRQYKLPKILKLNLKKWICGKGMVNVGLGEGFTELLNSEGYMCCLGQFCHQAGISKKDLLGMGGPACLETKIKGLTCKNKDEEGKYYESTKLSTDCIYINDNTETSVREKISNLKKILKKYGYKLKIKNSHLLKGE